MLTLLLPLAVADPGYPPDDRADFQQGAPRPLPGAGAWVAAARGLSPCPEPLAETCDGEPVPEGAALIVAEAGKHDGQPWVLLRRAGPASAEGQHEGAGAPLGWVPGGHVTRAMLTADLDGDGVSERILARFTDTARVELVLFPAQGPPQRLDLGDRADIEGPQVEATVQVLPAPTAGIPLVHVRWHAREQCGSGDWSAYASLQGAPPVLREALKHRGSGGDAPIFWETTATFDPKAKTAAVRFKAGESLDDGREQVNEDKTTRYVLKDGVYQQQAE
jgi:hypothetical protein